MVGEIRDDVKASRVGRVLKRDALKPWQSLLLYAPPSFFMVKCDDAVKLFFATTIKHIVWAFPLFRLDRNLWGLRLRSNFAVDIQPIMSLSEFWLLPDASAVRRLSLLEKGSADDGYLSFEIDAMSVEIVEPKRRANSSKKRATPEPDDVASVQESDLSSEDGREKDNVSTTSESESDSCSSSGTDADVDVKEGECKVGITVADRAPRRGKFIADRSDYFVYSNNPHFKDSCKVRLEKVWCTEEHLGRSQMSKAVSPVSLGETTEDPTRSLLVLRAWALGRFASVPSFIASVRLRSQWYSLEVAKLRRDIRALEVDGGGTGNAKADSMISRFSPAVLE